MTDELTQSQLLPDKVVEKQDENQQDNLPGIKVIARIRPFLEKEAKPQQPCIYKVGNAVCAQDPKCPEIKTETEFDKVLGPENNQEDVFKEMIPYLDRVMSGINLLQINYGVTSSGKTYTLFGTNENAGMLELSVQYIKQRLPDVNVHISVVQIYLNQITDLLNANQPLKVYATQADPLPQRKFEKIESPQQLRELLAKVDASREKSATMNNSQSSRSHCLIFVILENYSGESCICFVDLAGSEPFQAQGNRLLQQESSFIRTSLLMLDKAIRDLRAVTTLQGNSVSFRSSQLTMCLRPFLQPKLRKDLTLDKDKPQFELPGHVFMILNLHGLTSGFSSNKDTLNLGFICKQVKNFAKTPSRLGQLGQSMHKLMRSVKESGVSISATENDKSQMLESVFGLGQSQDYIAIKKNDWDQIIQQLQDFPDEIEQAQLQNEAQVREARQKAVEEVTEYYELEMEQLKAEYEQELYERDEEIIKLKRQLGIL